MPRKRRGEFLTFLRYVRTVLEVVMNVSGDLAACVHPRFVRTDSGHR
jgi:hypothetical protein